MNSKSAEGAESEMSKEKLAMVSPSSIISRLQREEAYHTAQPGPMAQAFTFRAFGA